jgi:hypothetical protein
MLLLCMHPSLQAELQALKNAHGKALLEMEQRLQV